MSSLTEEDLELRDLVAKVLDGSGVLGKMKAQLRAHVYTALETGDVPASSDLVNNSLKSFLDTTTGRLIASLVREFLEFFHLDFTLAVFDPESNLGKDFRYRGRSRLIDALGLTELVDPNFPLLSEIMRLSKVFVLKSESPTPTDDSAEDENTSNQTSLIDDQSINQSVSETAEKRNSSDWKKCSVVEESSEEGSNSTPQISLHLHPSILPQKPSSNQTQPNQLSNQALQNQQDLSSNQTSQIQPIPLLSQTKLTEPTQPTVPSDSSNTKNISPLSPAAKSGNPQPLHSGDKENKKEANHLGNLPPLGQLSSLSDLPPLTPNRQSGLAPLKKIQPISKPSPDKKPSPSSSFETDKPVDRTFTKPGASLGFQKNHVLSPKENTKRDKKSDEVKKLEDKYSDDFSVSEDIEEDLDSFLNSALDDNNDNFTQEEVVVNSDASLRADHVESL